ncbi:MAG: hypothetical protein PHC97_00825 [Patescibacteria group bacterium]|nr:hypothetical protein [Patescibacteria group bacterium]
MEKRLADLANEFHCLLHIGLKTKDGGKYWIIGQEDGLRAIEKKLNVQHLPSGYFSQQDLSIDDD